jgi:hypothetical protein
MEIWEIPKTGKIEFDMLKDLGVNNPPVKAMLKQMICGLAEHANEYYYKTCQRDHVFIDSEGELNGFITLAISKLTPTFKTEFPALRSYSTTKSGNLDFWIYHDNNVYLVELKLSHMGFAQGKCRDKKSIFEKYNEALNQLKGIENDDSLIYPYGLNALIKISLHAIVFHSDSSNIKMSLDEIHTKIKSSFNTLFEPEICYSRDNTLRFKDTIDYKALWYLDESIIRIKPGRFAESGTYPAVGFIGHVESVDL